MEEQNDNKTEKSRSRSRSRSNDKEENKLIKKKSLGIKNFNDLVECFKENRKEFLFKICFEDGFYYDKNAKNYLTSIIKKKLGDDGEIMEVKRIQISKPKEENFYYFRLNKEIKIGQVYIQSVKKEDLPTMKIFQLRPDKFFDDAF